MMALRVSINDESPVVAGAEDLGVLNAIVGCGGRLGALTHPHRSDESSEFNLHVGGLTSRGTDTENEHLRWLQRWDLKVGDRITVEIIETDRADPAIHSAPARTRPSA